MSVRRIQLKDISAIANGKTAIIKCPVGSRYRGIVLVGGDTGLGTTAAPTAATLWGDIRCILGSTIQRRVSATRLDVINSAMGSQYASNGVVGAANGGGRRYLPIFFSEPWRNRLTNTSVDINALAWTTNWMGSNGVFQVEVDLAASGVTTPYLSAFAIVDDVKFSGPTGIMKWYTKDKSTSAASAQIADLFQGVPNTDLFSQISLFDTSDSKTVTHAKLDIGGNTRWDLSYDSAASLIEFRGMNPASGAYHIVFDHDDALNDLEPAAGVTESNLELTLSAASAGTISMVVQRLGNPDAS